MPTPRPDTSLTASAVEKPGAKISAQTSASSRLSGACRPRSRALASSRWRDRPRPSSRTSMTIEPPWCDAASVSRPVSGLPAARRSAGVSMPWSMLLRTRCISGSVIFSIMPLSSSVASPCVTSSSCLPILAASSRSMRGKRLKTTDTGIMRMAIAASCSARVWRCSSASAADSCSWAAGCSVAQPCASIDSAVISSPTRLMSSSTLSTGTRSVPASPAGGCRARRHRRGGKGGDAQQRAVDMEGAQVDQLAVAARGAHLEVVQAVGAALQRLDRAQVGDLAEQLDQAVERAAVRQRPDRQLQQPLARRCGGAALGQRVQAGQQLARVGRIGAAALVARQHGAQRVAALQQQVDGRRRRRQLVAAQLVEQRFHLMCQFRHVGEAEGGGAALDRMGAAEDGVQRLVVGAGHVDAAAAAVPAAPGSRRPPRRRRRGTAPARCPARRCARRRRRRCRQAV